MSKGKSSSGRGSKRERQRRVLLGLVEHYLQTGIPVGSNTLREVGFQDLSSATLRNYFAQLEQDGFLHQPHTSGGRVPTAEGYREYSREHLGNRDLDPASAEALDSVRQEGIREVTAYLESVAEDLSQLCGTAVMLTAPRFDHDVLLDLKLVLIDSRRCLAVLVTDFGVVKTEVLRSSRPLTEELIEQMQRYFHWRLTGEGSVDAMEEADRQQAQDYYNELMVRYIVGYSNFSDEDIFRTGFSELLNYPEYSDVVTLASSLSLFESPQSIRLLMRDCCASEDIKVWIADDLSVYTSQEKANCAVIGVPYRIGPKVVGALGLLGPMRLPYRELFAILRATAEAMSTTLTGSVYTHKLQYRQPQHPLPGVGHDQRQLVVGQEEKILLEDKTQE